jgi:hypothetical protein
VIRALTAQCRVRKDQRASRGLTAQCLVLRDPKDLLGCKEFRANEVLSGHRDR